MRRKTADLAAGIAAALLIFGAVPAALLALTGLPEPTRLAHVRLASAGTDLQVLAAVAWVAWVGCCAPLVASVVQRVRRRDLSTAAGSRVPEWLASRMAAAVLALGPVAFTTGAGATVVPAAATAPVAPSTTGPATLLPPGPTPAGPEATTAVPASYTVADGDSLWSIAERFYDDGSEWPTIAQANLGQVMDDGTRFMDPSLIRSGWVLVLPPVTASSGATATGAGAGAAGATTTGAVGTEPATSQPVAAQPVAAQPVAAAGPGPARKRRGRTSAASGSHEGHRPAPAPAWPVPLPELAALGTGAVLAAALARRARRARHRAALVRPEGGLSTDPSEPAAGTAADLVPFERLPALEWLEAANRHLAAALEASGRAAEAPTARLVRVGPDGVEVRLASPASWAPPGWVTTAGPGWVLPATTDLGAVVGVGRGREPWLPALLPVGTDAMGTWLVPAEPGTCVPVLGAEAGALVAAMRVAAESWAWADQLVVTDDAAVAEDRSATANEWGDGLHRPRVVFFGDAAALSEPGRRRCAVVTTLPEAATDLTVTVDATAASLHPLGIVVRPDLLDGERLAAVDEVLAAGRAAGHPTTAPPATTARPATTAHPATTARPAAPARSSATSPVTATVAPLGGTVPPPRGGTALAGLRPGPVEVRLLAAVPRLDGLAEALTPKRSRRAVELVAYLALHHPMPVTSDRLRTRVLGSADADAAAKTLFNTAGAARRALGRDGEGEPLLPTATKGSHYRISAVVTTDVARATALVEAADRAEVPEEAMALLREALSLVEGEPLAQIGSGYGWWQAEGHEQRVAGTLVDAACRLAPMASAAGLVDLARWAVEQARLVEPYSEALCRVAMRVAADAGDADRLRREWQECLRRVNDLDPGSLPSKATEQLYVELCRRVPATTDGVAADSAVGR
ncbi:MAG TPA: LysM peptidoglycan-binding domain-containing protein [Acidimicrobiales bacterium]|nr:LysM peptidoglycan-binding domain-containing protein [Acidimicrobiales bacterium]